MIRPTPEEVTAYARRIGFILDGNAFCDFYESKGWYVGRSPMKVWQAAVRTWKTKEPRNHIKVDSKPIQTPSDPLKLEEAKQRLRDLADREWERRQQNKGDFNNGSI